MKIIITGANGFIGSNLVKYLEKEYELLTVTRNKFKNLQNNYDLTSFLNPKNFDQIYNFKATHFIHIAAIAHKKIQKNYFYLNELRLINEILPLKLYKLSEKLNIKRYLFLSTVGVHGYRTLNNQLINELFPYECSNVYSKSKLSAEKLLIKASKGSQTKLVILRPATVYGRDCPGNFNKLVKLIDLQIPFPLKRVDNSRSILYVKNLISAIKVLLVNPKVLGRKFVLADKEYISTKELISLIAKARYKKIYFFCLPQFFSRFIKRLPFLKVIFSQLTGNLKIDSDQFRELTGWVQPYDQKTSLIESFSIDNNHDD